MGGRVLPSTPLYVNKRTCPLDNGMLHGAVTRTIETVTGGRTAAACPRALCHASPCHAENFPRTDGQSDFPPAGGNRFGPGRVAHVPAPGSRGHRSVPPAVDGARRLLLGRRYWRAAAPTGRGTQNTELSARHVHSVTQCTVGIFPI